MKLKELLKAKKLYEQGRKPIIKISDGETLELEYPLFLYSKELLNVASTFDDRIDSYGIYDVSNECFFPIDSLTLLNGTLADMERAFRRKSPTTNAKHIGVELEFESKKSMDEVALLISNAKLSHCVQVKDDGSIECHSDNTEGIELAICAEEKSIFKILKKVTKLIKPFAIVNDSCGLHVHLDMRSRDFSKCLDKLKESEGLLYAIHSDRISNEYCIPSWVNNEYAASRYKGINTQAYSSHKTIEIRMASGSINYYDISNWILLLLKIINTKPLVNKELSSIKKQLKLGSEFNKFLKKKISNNYNTQELIRMDKIIL